MRHSDIAYVLIHLRCGSQDCLLLRHHTRCGDWSLVGGHVEADERGDWLCAAAREANEELPWQLGVDFEIARLDLTRSWGPRPSPAAAGVPTEYRAEYFLLEFLRDPHELLWSLPQARFRLVSLDTLMLEHVSTPVWLVLDEVMHGLAMSWHEDGAAA